MNVQILQLIDGAKKATGVAVVIDVFRAITVESFLYSNGAEKIIPVGDINKAYEHKAKQPEVVLIGERGGKICEGFDFGNSPSQIKNYDFGGKTVIHTTSAGTQGVANAKNADVILCACLCNAKATAEYIKELNPQTVSLVCMGLAGIEPTDEDTLCAEYIKSLLECKPISLEDKIQNLKQTSGAKFFDPAQTDVFPTEDFYLSTKADIFPFALRIETENGIQTTRKIDIKI